MRVRSWTIDGAAELPRLDSGELPNGLVVVFSDDARRKDTAIAMIRRVLFATPGSGDARTSVLLSASRGEFELAANGSPDSETFRTATGEPADLGELGRLFGNRERGQLQRVFDFAGAGDAAPLDPRLMFPACYDGTATIRRRMAELLADDGSGELDRLLAERTELDERLREAVAWESSYAERQAAERAATDAVGGLCAELADLRRRRERLKAYALVWPAWIAYQRTQSALIELEEIDDFPEGEVTLEEAEQNSESAETRLQALRRQHRQSRAEIETLPAPGDRHEVVDKVDAICTQLPSYRQRMSTFARARARYDELAGMVRELGKRVAGEGGETAFDPSHLDLGAARDWLTRSESLADRETMTRASLERTRGAIKQLRSERQRASRAAKALTVRLDDCDERWRALWSLRDDLEHLWEIQSQGEAAARTAEQRLDSLETVEKQHRHRPPNMWLNRAIWTVAAGAFAGALWYTRQEDEGMTVAFAGVVVGAVLLQVFLNWRWRLAQVRNRDMASKQERLRYDLERSRQLRDSRWRSADEISQRVEHAAVTLGLSPVPTVEEVDEAEAKLFSITRRLSERGPLAETALALQDHRDEEELLMAQLREIHQARDAAILEWEEWKRSVGLPASLAQDDLTTYLFEFDRWREIDDEMVAVDAQLRELAPTIEKWEAKARQLLISVGVASDDHVCGRDLEDQLTTLRDSAHRSRALLNRRAELGARIEDLDRELVAAEAASTEARRVFDALSKAAGTSDRVEFERRREVFQQRRRLLETHQAHEADLAAALLANHLTDDAELRADLAAGNADVWLEQGYDIDTQIDRLESDLDKTSHDRALAAAACREIETSSQVAALAQERACLGDEIRRRADEWRCLALADGLLEDAARSLSETATLLTDASGSLRRLTLGEMVRIAIPGDGEHMVVVDRGGEQHPVNGNLSPELIRLVQLSLQLSLARDFARGADAPPVVMDEVLRDLDGGKAAATAAEIAGLAEQHQVFYFTTDASAVEALRAAGAVSHVLNV